MHQSFPQPWFLPLIRVLSKWENLIVVAVAATKTGDVLTIYSWATDWYSPSLQAFRVSSSAQIGNFAWSRFTLMCSWPSIPASWLVEIAQRPPIFIWFHPSFYFKITILPVGCQNGVVGKLEKPFKLKINSSELICLHGYRTCPQLCDFFAMMVSLWPTPLTVATGIL